MPLGDEIDLTKIGKGAKAKASPIDRELDNFGRQIIDSEAKWRLASISTLKGLNRFVTAVSKAALTIERLKGLRAEQGISTIGLDPQDQRRFASLKARQKVAEYAIESAKSEKRLQQIKEKGVQDQITQQRRMDSLASRIERRRIQQVEQRARRIASSKRVAYGPDYFEPTTFVMQRKGKEQPLLGEYTSSRISGIRAPGTDVVPAGSRALVPRGEYPILPVYKTGVPGPPGVPIRGWMRGGPSTEVGPYRGATMPGSYGGGYGLGPFGIGGAVGTAWNAAKWGYNYTTRSMEKGLPDLENIYRASRTAGPAGYAGYLRDLGASPDNYRVDRNLAALGYNASTAADVQNIYASRFRSRSMVRMVGELSTDFGRTGTGNISKNEWADLLNKELSMNMLGGRRGFEQFQKAISDGFMDAGKHLLPPPEVMENVEKYLQVMSSSTAIRSGADVARMTTAAGQYGLPSFRNFNAQAQALATYDEQMKNLPANSLKFMEYITAATGYNGGRTPLMSDENLAGFAAKFGGLSKGFKFNKVQREALAEARKMGGMPGVLMQEHVLEMAGVKPEMLAKMGMGLFRSAGLPRSVAEFYETLTNPGAGPYFTEGRWATKAAAMPGGGTLPVGGSPATEEAAAKKYTLFGGKSIEKMLGVEGATDLFTARMGAESDWALETGKAVDAIAALGPSTNWLKREFDELAGSIHILIDRMRSGIPSTPAGHRPSWAKPRDMSIAPEAPGSSGAPRLFGKPSSSSTHVTPATPSS